MEQREQPITPPATPPNKHGVPAEEYESGYVTSPNTVENTTPAISDRSSTAKPFPGIPSCEYKCEYLCMIFIIVLYSNIDVVVTAVILYSFKLAMPFI